MLRDHREKEPKTLSELLTRSSWEKLIPRRIQRTSAWRALWRNYLTNQIFWTIVASFLWVHQYTEVHGATKHTVGLQCTSSVAPPTKEVPQNLVSLLLLDFTTECKCQSYLMVEIFSPSFLTFRRIISRSWGKNRSMSIFRNTRFRWARSLELSLSLKASGICSNGS